MAVDKTLPNISEQPEETTEDLAVEMEEQLREQADTEVTELEDGGVEINFDPNAVAQGQETDFNANLAEQVSTTSINNL